MNYSTYFRVYNHSLVLEDGQIVIRKFIILNKSDGSFQFTDFHKYIKNPNRRIHRITSNSNNRATFVCQFLNYVFFVAGIKSLDRITVDVVKSFLNDYGQCNLPEDDEFTSRNKDTVERCVATIMDFLKMLIDDKSNKCRIRESDLYRKVEVRDKHGRIKSKKVPVFDVYYNAKYRALYRDIPNKAFNVLFNHIVNHHPDLLMLVALSAFAGLRPSEACNVRRVDSPLGAGIHFKEIDGEIISITIDLTRELNLRSDLVKVGGIKKERTQTVPDIFLSAFRDAYEKYMNHINGRKYEAEFGALTNNRNGKAITYQSYYQKFRDIIQNELIDIYLNSGDPELMIYGRTLQEQSLSPHIFRHWYTVQLVLSGVQNVGVLKDYRGDKHPESALVYLNNKGELQKKYQKVNNETIEYMLWASKKQHHKERS